MFWSKDMIRIMLVDDSQALLKLIQGIISAEVKFDTEVFTFSNAVVAKEQFSKISPDFVITDIEMPNFDGYQLIEYIRSISATTILAISGSNHEDNCTNTILHCAKLHGADYSILKKDIVENFSSLITEMIVTHIQ